VSDAMVRKCCSASISVGAINPAWYPFSMAISMQGRQRWSSAPDITLKKSFIGMGDFISE